MDERYYCPVAFFVFSSIENNQRPYSETFIPNTAFDSEG